MPDISLSVVIATRNNSKNLLRLLRTLGAQYMLMDHYEVVVVDAQSTDDTDQVMRGNLFGFRYQFLEAPRPGLMAARNYGVEESRGDHILFLSDDLLAPSSLLEAHHLAHKQYPHQVVRGPIVHLEAEPMPMLDHPPPCSRLFFTIVNSSVSKMALMKLGGFAENAEPGVEDREIGWRLHKDGWSEKFLPAAYAWHCRSSGEGGALGDLETQARLLARSAVAHYLKHPDPAVARTTGIHPMARASAALTAGPFVHSMMCRFRETPLGRMPWLQGHVDQQIFMCYYREALEEELGRHQL